MIYIFNLGITIFILAYIVIFINKIWDFSTRPERFKNQIDDLNTRNCRITYQNETTGTISYIENGVKHQISVYRGYNSHARRY